MNKKQYSILIIDDDKQYRDSIFRILSKKEYNLIFAENGFEGLKLLKSEQPEIILLDLKMPFMSGEDFLKKIQFQITDWQSIIVISGIGNDENIKKCFDLGISEFLHKPFSKYELLGIIQNSLNIKNEYLKLEEKLKALRIIQDELKSLKEYLHICKRCKKVKISDNEWMEIEMYFHKKSDVLFSHGLCFDCIKKLYPVQYSQLKDEGKIIE